MAAHRLPTQSSLRDDVCLECGETRPASAECPGDRRHVPGDEIITGGFYACEGCGVMLDGDEPRNCPQRRR
jgi:hypothetical protein